MSTFCVVNFPNNMLMFLSIPFPGQYNQRTTFTT